MKRKKLNVNETKKNLLQERMKVHRGKSCKKRKMQNLIATVIIQNLLKDKENKVKKGTRILCQTNLR